MPMSSLLSDIPAALKVGVLFQPNYHHIPLLKYHLVTLSMGALL